jgi:hypothetical protein
LNAASSRTNDRPWRRSSTGIDGVAFICSAGEDPDCSLRACPIPPREAILPNGDRCPPRSKPLGALYCACVWSCKGGISRQSALWCRRVSAGSTGPGPTLVVFRLPTLLRIAACGEGTKTRKIALLSRGLGGLGQGSECAWLPRSPWARLLLAREDRVGYSNPASSIEEIHT